MSGIVDLLYVRFSVPDLEAQASFLRDFGFATEQVDDLLLARGTDADRFVYTAVEGEAKFLGLGFEAETQADLERIAAIDGVAVEDSVLPGGGLMARMTDPEGNAVDVVHGLDKPAPLAIPGRSPLNDGAQRPRLGERVAFTPGDAVVKRLGHCVLNVHDFRVSEAWYKQRIGLLTSDEVYAGSEDKVIGAFMRCNRGETYVDHHTLFLVGAGNSDFNHAAFEVADWDALMQGHHLLEQQGYEHRWGVGKHLLGSQVFDYWKDPAGFTLEHFTDGDLMNESFGSHRVPIDQLLGMHWGPQGAP